MRRRRELPDTRIVPFPDNWRGDDSPGAHHATWGPNHDTPPLRATSVVLVERGKTIAMFTLHVVLRRGLGFYIPGCRLVQWGPGERVFLPQRQTTVKTVTVSDDDEQEPSVDKRTYYTELITFDTNRGQKAFEEAALAAVRPAVAQLRSEQHASADEGAASDDVPFP